VSYVTIGKARRSGIRALPILSYSLCCTYTIGAAIFTPLKGEVQRKKKSMNFWYWRSKCAPLRLIAQGTAQRQKLQQRILYSAITVGATPLIALNLFLLNSPIIWAVPAGNRNIVLKKMKGK
jgi:hypothetical protein